MTIEPRVGGRVFETLHDGRELEWGEVSAFEPGALFAVRWRLGRPVEETTDVSVRFEATSAESCRVTLTHENWERMGDEAAKLRDAYNGGWVKVFEHGFGARRRARMKEMGPMTLKLHVFPQARARSRCWRSPTILASTTRLCFCDLTKGDQKQPAFTAINPNQKMPALEDGGFKLWESNAIIQYLAGKRPGVLAPTDAQGARRRGALDVLGIRPPGTRPARCWRSSAS